jgi:hypothetical protein
MCERKRVKNVKSMRSGLIQLIQLIHIFAACSSLYIYIVFIFKKFCIIC